MISGSHNNAIVHAGDNSLCHIPSIPAAFSPYRRLATTPAKTVSIIRRQVDQPRSFTYSERMGFFFSARMGFFLLAMSYPFRVAIDLRVDRHVLALTLLVKIPSIRRLG